MGDEIDYGKLTDREILILACQAVNTHSKRLDSHAADIKSLREWRNYLTGGITTIAALLGIHMKAH